MNWINSKIFKLLGVDSGLAYVTLGNLGSAILVALFWLILASLLIAESYGQLNYLLASTFIFGTVALLGLNPTVTTFTAKGNEKIKYQSNLLALVSSVAFIAPLILLTGVSAAKCAANRRCFLPDVHGRTFREKEVQRIYAHTCRSASCPDSSWDIALLFVWNGWHNIRLHNFLPSLQLQILLNCKTFQT